MRDTRLTGRHHRLLLCLAWHYRLGRNGRPCNAKLARLAREAILDRADVSKLLGDLERWGYLEVTRHSRSGNYRACTLKYNTYSEFVGADTNTSPDSQHYQELTANALEHNAYSDFVGEIGKNVGTGTNIESFQNPQIRVPGQRLTSSARPRKRRKRSTPKKVSKSVTAGRVLTADLVPENATGSVSSIEPDDMATTSAHERIVRALPTSLRDEAKDMLTAADWHLADRAEAANPGKGLALVLDKLGWPF
jgi:hypothetical protein